MTQLIFFDIDDTLSRQGRLANGHIAMLKSLSAIGIKLVIATGRGRAMLPKDIMTLFYEDIFSGIICMNGQYSFTQPPNKNSNEDHIISHYPLSQNDAQTIVNICERNEVIYKFDSNKQIAWAQHSKLSKMTADNPNFIVSPNFYKNNDVYQCSVFFNRNDEEKDLNTNLAELDLRMVYWHSTGGDLLPKSASKARGIKDVCQYFSIELDNTMAFGDGLNDIEMLQIVGTSIAMGNAVDELKQHADFVTYSIEDQGIQFALQKYGIL